VPAERYERAADGLALEIHEVDDDPRGWPTCLQRHFGERRAGSPDDVVLLAVVQLAKTRDEGVRPPALDDDRLAWRDKVAQLLAEWTPDAVGPFRTIEDVAVVDREHAHTAIVQRRPLGTCRSPPSASDEGEAIARRETVQQMVGALNGAVVERPRI